MKRILYFVLITALGFAACTPKTGEHTSSSEDFRKTAPAPGPAPKIELGTYDQFQLDNGLKVIVVENHKLPACLSRSLWMRLKCMRVNWRALSIWPAAC
ncbi:MAG: hypothetical protein IPJ40_04520 [Saprospirales bacterium]|nr:hypothetical protein [Saprospirales bacterium]